MRAHLFIDNNNIFYDAQRTIGVKRRFLRSDPRVRIFTDILGQKIRGKHDIAKEHLFASNSKLKGPPRNVWGIPITEVRSQHTLIEDMAAEIQRTILKHKPGVLIIVSGNMLLERAVNKALNNGWKVEIWGWRDSISMALRSLCQHKANAELREMDDMWEEITFTERIDSTQRASAVRRMIVLECADSESMDCKSLGEKVDGLLRWPSTFHFEPGQVVLTLSYLYTKQKLTAQQEPDKPTQDDISAYVRILRAAILRGVFDSYAITNVYAKSRYQRPPRTPSTAPVPEKTPLLTERIFQIFPPPNPTAGLPLVDFTSLSQSWNRTRAWRDLFTQSVVCVPMLVD